MQQRVAQDSAQLDDFLAKELETQNACPICYDLMVGDHHSCRQQGIVSENFMAFVKRAIATAFCSGSTEPCTTAALPLRPHFL